LADAGRFSFFDGRHVADVPVKQMAAMAAERLSS
jgi:hypothetical protein